MDYNKFKQQLIEQLKHEFKDKYMPLSEDVFLPGHKERKLMSEVYQDAIKIVQDFKPYVSNYH